MKITRPSRLQFVLLLITALGLVAALYMEATIGILWHLTHSPEVKIGNAKVYVPRGWSPIKRDGNYSLGRYPKDHTKTIVTLTNETKAYQRDPKAAVESIGRTFEAVEKVLIGGSQGQRITSYVEEDDRPYVVTITIPSQNLVIGYHGTKEGIPAFDSFVEGISFSTESSTSPS